MKKVLFALAIAGMFGFAACNNNKNVEENVEAASENVEAVVEEGTETVENAVEEVIDSAMAVVAEVAAE